MEGTADIALRSAAAVGDNEAIRAALNEGAGLDSIGFAIVNARSTGIRMIQEPSTGTRFVLTHKSEERRAANALQFALTNGHATAARELLKLGADPRLTLDGVPSSTSRNSPLFSAFSTPSHHRAPNTSNQISLLDVVASPTHAPILAATRPGSRGGVGIRQLKRNIGGVATPLKPRPPFEDISSLQARMMSPAGEANHERGWADSDASHSPRTNGNQMDGLWLGTAVHIANVNQCCAEAVWEVAQGRENSFVVPRSGSSSSIRRVQGLAPLRRVPVATSVAPLRRSSEPARGVAPSIANASFTRGRTTPQVSNDVSNDASIELEALTLPSAADLRDVVVLPGRRSTATPPRLTPIRTPTPERNMECMRQLSEVRGEVEAFLASHQFYSGTPTTVNTGKDILDWDGDLHKRVQPPMFAFAAPTPTRYPHDEDEDEDIQMSKKPQLWSDAHNKNNKNDLLGGQKYFDVEDGYDFDDASGSDSDTDAPPCFPRTPLSYLSQFSNMASPSSALQILGSLGQIRYEVAAENA